MGSISLKQFQDQVSELLLRHRSILDVLSKYQQSNAATNRAIIKSITECGCIEVHATKQTFAPNLTLEQAKELLDTHLTGQLCDNCQDIIASEIGKNLFYLASLCNLLQLDLESIISKESDKCSTLGLFNLS